MVNYFIMIINGNKSEGSKQYGTLCNFIHEISTVM